MNPEWWESPCRFLCKYWWALLLALLLLLAAFFTRNLWLPAPLPTPVPTAATGLHNVRTSQRNIELMLRDNQTVDGDRVKVSLNGQVVIPDYTLTGDAHSIPIQLNKGDNTITIQALNEGSSPPNTVEVSISNVVSGPSVQLSNGLQTGETESFVITAP